VNWAIIIILSLLGLSLAALLVSVDAKLLMRVRRPGARWILAVVGCMLLAFVPISVVALIVAVPAALKDFEHLIATPYQRLPNLTALCIVPSAVTLIGLLSLSIYGALPAHSAEYQPKAAAWLMRSRLKQMGWLMAALVVAIIAQEIELRVRLAQMEAQADRIAASMQRGAIADEENAAKHYQRVVEMIAEVDRRRDADEFDRIERALVAGGPIDEKTREYFDHLQLIFSKLRAASQCPDCRYDDQFAVFDWLDGSATNSGIASAISQFGQYARCRICEQQSGDAIECMKIARRWQEHLLKDPRNLRTRSFLSSEKIIRETLEHLATYCQAPPVDDLKTLLAGPIPTDQIVEPTLKWHAAVVKKTLAATYDGRMFQRPELQPSPIFSSQSPLAKAACQLAYATMRLTWGRDDIDSVNKRFAFLDTPYDTVSWDVSHTTKGIADGEFAWRIMSTEYVETSRWNLISAESNRRLSNIAIASILYRRDHGGWPRKIDGLSPSYLPNIPLDPEFGGPFVLKAVGDGFVVLSGRAAKEIEGRGVGTMDSGDDAWIQEAIKQRQGSPMEPSLFIGDGYRRAAP
jgi:hypothetical protein